MKVPILVFSNLFRPEESFCIIESGLKYQKYREMYPLFAHYILHNVVPENYRVTIVIF